MASVVALIMSSLDQSIDKLKVELQPLSGRLKADNQSIVIMSSYDRDSMSSPLVMLDEIVPAILVYGPTEYKAYIPKRYDGWDVLYHNWLTSQPLP